MVTIKVELWKTLQDLTEDQFQTFKWFLEVDNSPEGFSGISKAQLEKAERRDTVDLMVEKYHGDGALKLTLKVLEKISQNDPVQRLENFSSTLKEFKTQHGGPQAGRYNKSPGRYNRSPGRYNRSSAKLESLQQFAVEVTLDPDTAHPALVLSDDKKQVHAVDVWKKLPFNPKRFDSCVNVLGKQSFSSGKFYYEVQVKGKTDWDLGVASESIGRKEEITLSPEFGFWTLWLRNGDEYTANDSPSVHLSLKSHPQKVGVFVDYDEGLVSFYDVDTADLLYSFNNCSFTEKIFPFFSPSTNDGGKNSAPLIISPAKDQLRKEDSVDQKERYERKKSELKSLQQFAVEVTLDPDTAHPALVLSDDEKQVHDSDEWKKLPFNPKRFDRCVNVLGKQSFSSGKFYYEVQVKGKTDWDLGVASESIGRKGEITLGPEFGLWTLGLRNGDEYTANESPSVHLPLKSHPQKVGVFVDYERGLICFYNVDTADLIYCFTDCSFTEKIFPFFSPSTNDGGKNSAPLIISLVKDQHKKQDSVDQKERYERKKSELKSLQQFAVEVTLDPDTAHPALVLSDDEKQVHAVDEWKKLPFNPKRFDRSGNVLGKQSFSSGRFYYEVQVKGKTDWDLGVASESIGRKEEIILGPEFGFWTLSLRNGDQYTANESPSVRLPLRSHPQKVGVFVDYEGGLICFYNVDAADLIYCFTDCFFTEKIFPFFSPCSNHGGKNSAPLIISPNQHKKQDSADQKERYEMKKAELKSLQQFAVEVTLDPDTAHPALVLSDDEKQVHDSDEWKKLPFNPKRFDRCVNVLGKQSFSSGKFYYEVQVKGKTDWDLGVASESIGRKGEITLGPEFGLWTLGLRNGDEYTANESPSVHLPLKSHPQKVGVFVDYEGGLICFYNVDAADLIYCFTDCSFTEKIFPFFSPSTNDGGKNSAPLIISLVKDQHKKQDSVDQKERYERKKSELKSLQQFAVEVTLDPDTAHPALVLSDDEKQVHAVDEWKKLPFNPKRFDRSGNVLGKQSFSSGTFYFEVQVKGKTEWDLGVASESIGRKGQITLGPEFGFWTLGLRNGDEYTANDSPSVRLPLKTHPQKVGVFVDYEGGLICFYNVDAADLIYCFTDCSFTEKIFPFFSPSDNDGGKNSAPLIICPVDHQG